MPAKGQRRSKLIKLLKEVSIQNTEELLNNLSDQLTKGSEVVVDAAKVEHIDACGLQLLLAGAKEARRNGKSFILTNPSAYLEHVLYITGADKVVPVQKEG